MITNGFNCDGSDNDRIRMFLANPENIYNCDKCPYQLQTYEQFLPCGQQNCWVQVSCEERSQENE